MITIIKLEERIRESIDESEFSPRTTEADIEYYLTMLAKQVVPYWRKGLLEALSSDPSIGEFFAFDPLVAGGDVYKAIGDVLEMHLHGYASKYARQVLLNLRQADTTQNTLPNQGIILT